MKSFKDFQAEGERKKKGKETIAKRGVSGSDHVKGAIMTAQKEVLIWKRFECAFPESKYWHGPKRGYGAGDNGNRYMRLQYASGASIYFPLSVNHAHIVPRSVRNFRPRAEELQRCLDENKVPKGCRKQDSDQYVIGLEHADAIIEILRNG